MPCSIILYEVLVLPINRGIKGFGSHCHVGESWKCHTSDTATLDKLLLCLPAYMALSFHPFAYSSRLSRRNRITIQITQDLILCSVCGHGGPLVRWPPKIERKLRGHWEKMLTSALVQTESRITHPDVWRLCFPVPALMLQTLHSFRHDHNFTLYVTDLFTFCCWF